MGLTEYTCFRDRSLPEADVSLAGYAALIDYYDLLVPLPEKLCFISHRHQRYETQQWAAFSKRHQPKDTLPGHLTFALKYEGVDLAVFKALFNKINPEKLASWIRFEPTGRYSRRIWFLYEWLTNQALDVPDVTRGNYVDCLNPEQQYGAGIAISSRRHRVYNNMPGTRLFCPLIRRTAKLESCESQQLENVAKKYLQLIPPHLLNRVSTLMLLKETKVEFERGAPLKKNRQDLWNKVLRQAGKRPLTLDELLSIQSMMIEDQRFIKLGLRLEEGFIGDLDSPKDSPIPQHIGAKWQDLPSLMKDLLETYEQVKTQDVKPIILATSIAFGFLFMRPFQDGNGRITRYIVHHVLADLDFVPKSLILPLSAVIMEREDDFLHLLNGYSAHCLDLIHWQATSNGQLTIANETMDLYRYFDATHLAEFLYESVRQAIETSLFNEMRYIEQHDSIKATISERFDMPETVLEALIHSLFQNQGGVSKDLLENELRSLTEQECQDMKKLYVETCTYKKSLPN